MPNSNISSNTDVSPTDTFNKNMTAIPKDTALATDQGADDDLVATPMDYGPMNSKDAKVSGYIDKNGNAVDLAKKSDVGHPTGAFTDLGAGRSSVVKDHKETKS